MSAKYFCLWHLSQSKVCGVQVDPSVSFDQVGGLEQYVKALKEMVFLPLVYPELFERFHIVPPRGVLFYGPPGRLLIFSSTSTSPISLNLLPLRTAGPLKISDGESLLEEDKHPPSFICKSLAATKRRSAWKIARSICKC